MAVKKLESVPIEALIPYARNARKHSDEQVAQLAASIREFGFNAPVLVDSENGIIAGHGRVLAARKLGLEAVPCLRLDHLTDTQRKAYILADNRLAELGGGWDEEMLGIELADLREVDFDLDLAGFDAQKIEEFLNSKEPEIVENTKKPSVMSDFVDKYDDSIVRQIVLIYSLQQYNFVMEAFGNYAEKNGLNNNVEVVNHLLETNGYAISERATEKA
jgi:ParB-like chromosome segregation protein Spo0J